jgi:hypothetical protein
MPKRISAAPAIRSKLPALKEDVVVVPVELVLVLPEVVLVERLAVYVASETTSESFAIGSR